jgi:hypothetical protein
MLIYKFFVLNLTAQLLRLYLCKARAHTILTPQSPSQYIQVPAYFTVCLGALVYLPPFSSKVIPIVFEGLSALSL